MIQAHTSADHPSQSVFDPPRFADDGSAGSEEAICADHGITRQVTCNYTVGGYRYSKLSDALAQVRRNERAETPL